MIKSAFWNSLKHYIDAIIDYILSFFNFFKLIYYFIFNQGIPISITLFLHGALIFMVLHKHYNKISKNIIW